MKKKVNELDRMAYFVHGAHVCRLIEVVAGTAIAKTVQHRLDGEWHECESREVLLDMDVEVEPCVLGPLCLLWIATTYQNPDGERTLAFRHLGLAHDWVGKQVDATKRGDGYYEFTDPQGKVVGHARRVEVAP